MVAVIVYTWLGQCRRQPGHRTGAGAAVQQEHAGATDSFASTVLVDGELQSVTQFKSSSSHESTFASR